MNQWFEVVDRIKHRSERFEALRCITDGRIGARANRGRDLGSDRVDALIWGLGHPSPVVRRSCLELLDQHPDPRALPAIIECLNDKVPRVRWHAVHALICDACKPGTSYLTDEALERIQRVAQHDPSPKVRSQAQWGLAKLEVPIGDHRGSGDDGRCRECCSQTTAAAQLNGDHTHG